MSENRKKYSSSPLYGLKGSNRGQGGGFQVRMDTPRETAPQQQQQQSGGNFIFLQICMTLVLPLLFLLALILRLTELHWAFIVLSLLAVFSMWMGGAFIPQARKTMTLIYTALILVALAAAMWFTSSMFSAPDHTGSTQNSALSDLFGRDVTASQVGAFSDTVNQHANRPTSAPTPDSRSQAQERLELFMSSWMNLDYNTMLEYCSPAWKNAQSDPAQSIFKIRGTQTPTKYNITNISGNDADDSRTITMVASIDRGDGNAPKDYRYEVLMLRVNGQWYIDPASLSTSTKVENKAEATPVHTIIPTPTPNPNQILYYNPDGGTFYHLDKECTSTAKKFLPFKGSFTYGQLSEHPTLNPCTKCRAPSR